MITKAQLRELAMRGWPVLVQKSYDLCWLDCDKTGWLKTSDDGTRVICLCPAHALLLEEGVYDGSYSGAGLPPGSMASEWPWRDSLAVVPA